MVVSTVEGKMVSTPQSQGLNPTSGEKLLLQPHFFQWEIGATTWDRFSIPTSRVKEGNLFREDHFARGIYTGCSIKSDF